MDNERIQGVAHLVGADDYSVRMVAVNESHLDKQMSHILKYLKSRGCEVSLKKKIVEEERRDGDKIWRYFKYCYHIENFTECVFDVWRDGVGGAIVEWGYPRKVMAHDHAAA